MHCNIVMNVQKMIIIIAKIEGQLKGISINNNKLKDKKQTSVANIGKHE